jgi:hypothetical protein
LNRKTRLTHFAPRSRRPRETVGDSNDNGNGEQVPTAEREVDRMLRVRPLSTVRAQDALIAGAQRLLTDYLSRKKSRRRCLSTACSTPRRAAAARSATARAGSDGQGLRQQRIERHQAALSTPQTSGDEAAAIRTFEWTCQRITTHRLSPD